MLKLSTLFVVVAVVETFYGAAALLTPPGLILPLLGWNLTPDGHWVTKLLGAALLAQAGTAWVLRRQAPPEVAWIFALYQFTAVMVDVLLWVHFADQGIFANTLARVSVMAAIPTHSSLGIALAIAASRGTARRAGSEVTSWSTQD